MMSRMNGELQVGLKTDLLAFFTLIRELTDDGDMSRDKRIFSTGCSGKKSVDNYTDRQV